MCRLPTGVINSEVEDLRERIERYIDKALEYACRFWYRHLVGAEQTRKPEITPVLHQFVKEKFLFWLEVLSVLDAARVAVDALEATKSWLDVRYFVLFVLCRNSLLPRVRHHQPSISPAITFVSWSRSSKSSAYLHHTSIFQHFPYPPKHHSYARRTKNMPLPWRGLCGGCQFHGNSLLPSPTCSPTTRLRGRHAAGSLPSRKDARQGFWMQPLSNHLTPSNILRMIPPSS